MHWMFLPDAMASPDRYHSDSSGRPMSGRLTTWAESATAGSADNATLWGDDPRCPIYGREFIDPDYPAVQRWATPPCVMRLAEIPLARSHGRPRQARRVRCFAYHRLWLARGARHSWGSPRARLAWPPAPGDLSFVVDPRMSGGGAATAALAHHHPAPPDALRARAHAVVERKRRSRRLLDTTNTDESAIANPAIIGLSKPRAANGSAATL